MIELCIGKQIMSPGRFVFLHFSPSQVADLSISFPKPTSSFEQKRTVCLSSWSQAHSSWSKLSPYSAISLPYIPDTHTDVRVWCRLRNNALISKKKPLIHFYKRSCLRERHNNSSQQQFSFLSKIDDKFIKITRWFACRVIQNYSQLQLTLQS